MAIRKRAAETAVSPRSRKPPTISTTIWLGKNSHTPSDASTMNWSVPATSGRKPTSGVAITPHASASMSPSERLMVKPCTRAHVPRARWVAPRATPGLGRPY